MKNTNKLLIVLSLLLVIFLSPVSAKTKITDRTNAPRILLNTTQNVYIQSVDPVDAYNKMIALQSQYPEGKHWTNDDFYESNTGAGGYGCHAFALILSDAAFGNLPIKEHYDVNNIRVGDILRVENNRHSVIVLEVHPDFLVIAEGNFNDSIHWGRHLKRDGLQVDFIWTRYPDSESEEPDEPSQPEQPNTPSQPDEPEIPTQPDEPNYPDQEDSLEVSPKDMTLSTTTTPRYGTISVRATVSSMEDYLNGVKFQSENQNIAVVDSEGLVTAVAPGTTRITVQVGSMVETVNVTVIAPATDINLSSDSTVEFTLNKEPKTSQIVAETVPEDSTDSISYSSADTSIATVTSSGLITPVKEGTTTISVKAGSVKKEIKVVVNEESDETEPSQPSTPTIPDKPSTPSTPSTPNETPKPSDTNNAVSIYRLYNGESGEHLYTPDYNEYITLSRDYGWTGEGEGWKAPQTGTAVYRLYNPALNDHLYTTDTNEVSVLTSGNGWQADNGGKPLFYSGGSTPVYRLYHNGTKRHHLTKDSNEYNILGVNDWNQEGHKLSALN